MIEFQSTSSLLLSFLPFNIFIFQALSSAAQRRVNHTLVVKSSTGCLPFASENHTLTTRKDVSSLSPAFLGLDKRTVVQGVPRAKAEIRWFYYTRYCLNSQPNLTLGAEVPNPGCFPRQEGSSAGPSFCADQLVIPQHREQLPIHRP